MTRSRTALIENIETGEQYETSVFENALKEITLDEILKDEFHLFAFGIVVLEYKKKGFADLDIENDEWVILPEKKEDFLRDVAKMESKLHFVGWADDWTEIEHCPYKRGV